MKVKANSNSQVNQRRILLLKKSRTLILTQNAIKQMDYDNQLLNSLNI